MRERILTAGGIGCFVLLFLIGVVSNEYTARYCIGQYQAVVGNLYKESPKAAERLLYTTFNGQRDEEAKQAGLHAAKKAGYTEEAFTIYYHQLFPNRGRFVLLGMFFLISCFLGAFVWNYRFWEIQRVVQLKERLYRYEKEGAAFSIEKSAGGEWLSLEYYLWRLIDAKEKQKAYFAKRQEQMQMFMENIAHQIKTPLACILLNLELLQDKEEFIKGKAARNGIGMAEIESRKEDKVQTGPARDALHLIMDSTKQGERIQKLLFRLLNLARLEAGKIHFRMEQVSLEELLCEICAAFPEGSVLVSGEEMEGEEWIWGDRQWLFEAVFNLVDNSVRYAKDKPVEIQVRILQDNVKITVRDFGKGLTKAEIQKVFERYYMGDTTDGFRTGIGLNLSKYVIEGHHGTIRANSLPEGGMAMEISLPKFFWKEKIVL